MISCVDKRVVCGFKSYGNKVQFFNVLGDFEKKVFWASTDKKNLVLNILQCRRQKYHILILISIPTLILLGKLT